MEIEHYTYVYAQLVLHAWLRDLAGPLSLLVATCNTNDQRMDLQPQFSVIVSIT